MSLIRHVTAFCAPSWWTATSCLRVRAVEDWVAEAVKVRRFEGGQDDPQTNLP